MTTPKNPEEIMATFQTMLEASPIPALIQRKMIEWLRSSMASLLLYMAERMTEDDGKCSCDSRNEHLARVSAMSDCRTLLTNEARKITNNE